MSMMPAVAAKEDIGACRRNNNAERETTAAVNGRTSAGPSAVGTATAGARAGPCMRRRPGRLSSADQGAIRPAETPRPTKPATSKPHPAVLRGVQCSCVGHGPDCTGRGMHEGLRVMEMVAFLARTARTARLPLLKLLHGSVECEDQVEGCKGHRGGGHEEAFGFAPGDPVHQDSEHEVCRQHPHGDRSK